MIFIHIAVDNYKEIILNNISSSSDYFLSGFIQINFRPLYPPGPPPPLIPEFFTENKGLCYFFFHATAGGGDAISMRGPIRPLS